MLFVRRPHVGMIVCGFLLLAIVGVNAADPTVDVSPESKAPAAAATTPDELVRLLFNMLNEPPSTQQRPGFVDAVLETADQVLAAETSDAYKTTAVLAKFRILHAASLAGEKTADARLAALAEKYRSDSRKKVAAFVRFVDMERKLLAAENASAEESAKLLDELKPYLGKEELTNRQLRMATITVDLINRQPEKQREALFKSYGQLFAKSVDGDLAKVGERLGKPAPKAGVKFAGQPLELTGTTSSGDEFKWDGYRDKVVIVDFWASWCGPCRAEMPTVRRLYDKYHRLGLEVVGVSLDTNVDPMKRYLIENDIPWITLSGPATQELASKYGIRGIPTMFLVDKEGKILNLAHRVSDFEQQIETLLAEKKK